MKAEFDALRGTTEAQREAWQASHTAQMNALRSELRNIKWFVGILVATAALLLAFARELSLIG